MTTVTVYVDFGLREHEPRTLPASCDVQEGQYLTLAEYRLYRRASGRPDKRGSYVGVAALAIIAVALVAAALIGGLRP